LGYLRAIAGGKAGVGASGLDPAAVGASRPGDAGLLAELYETHAAAVLARCRFLLKDDEAARDAAQEVFVRSLRALSELRSADSPVAWILRVATHHCLNELRSQRALWRDRIQVLVEERSLSGADIDRKELLRALLSVAPIEAQEVAVLYYVDEMTQAEIGATMGLSLPTVRKRLRQFLKAARGALAQSLPGIALPDAEEI
jgi:RNA polymerase sigma factor (sigma-70 family)